MTIVKAMRKLGVTPAANVTPGAAEVHLMQAGISLTFAQSLHVDLLRGNVGSFNISRPDGTSIVKGCNDTVWRSTRDVSLSKALAHLEQAESDGVVLPAFPAVDSLDAFFENYDNAAFRAAVSYKAELPAVAQAALV